MYELGNRLLASGNLDPAIELDLPAGLKAMSLMDPDDVGSQRELKLRRQVKVTTPM